MYQDNIKLTVNQEQKNTEFLYNLKKELEELQYQEKHVGLINIKIYMLKVLKVFLRITKDLSPYIATAILTFLILKTFNFDPFIQDNAKKKLETKKLLDSQGNTRYEMQYDNTSIQNNIIQVFSKWEKEGNYYIREIKNYSVEKINTDLIEEIVSNNISFEKIGEPISIQTEKRNNLTNDEINTKPYVQAIIRSTTSDDVIVFKERKNSNNVSFIIWLLLNFSIDLTLLKFLDKDDSEELSCYIRRLNDEYPKIVTKDLSKIIEIKKQNYDTLTR